MRLISVSCKTNPIKRSTGGNAVAAAAYRAGEDLTDEQSGEIKRFSNRIEDVRETIILAPDDAPDWTRDRSSLWNAAENRETHVKGRPGRDVLIGFAWEASPEQQREMATEFAKKHFVSQGHVCDIAFHKYGALVSERDKIIKQKDDTTITGSEQIKRWKDQGLPFIEAYQTQHVDMPHVKIERLKGGDIRGYKIYQPHAHVLVTTRAVNDDGWVKTKNRSFDRKETALYWREDWANLQNSYLEKWGYEVRVSTTKNQASENLPTRSEQISAPARHLERKGTETMEGKKVAANQAMNELIEGISQKPVDQPDDTSFHRAAVWWRNLMESFSDWREQLADKAASYLSYLNPNRDKQEQGRGYEQD